MKEREASHNRSTLLLAALLAVFVATVVPVRAQDQSKARPANSQSTNSQPASSQSANSQPANSPNQNRAQSSQPESADISFTATVRARELKFEAVPDVKVEFTGSLKRDTAWEAEREKLPRPVEPGVTYRDIGVTLKITSAFADIERIVSEALGEVPPREEEAQPNMNPPEPPKPVEKVKPRKPGGGKRR